MAKREGREMKENKREVGTLELTGMDVLPKRAVLAHPWIGEYSYRFTTGPFLLPQNSGSLDWILLNNDVTQQMVRVTVFKCAIGAVKSPLPPGPLVVTLDPGETSHNANEYPEGFVYEIQVECNSLLVFPHVSVWPANFGVSIPGTAINSGSFVRLMHRH